MTAATAFYRFYDGHGAEARLFILWWFAAVPVTFAVVGGNHSWYLFPIIVPAGLAVGVLGSIAIRWLNDRLSARGYRPVPLLVYLLAGLLVVAIVMTNLPFVQEKQPKMDEQRELASALEEIPAGEIYISDTASDLYSYQVFSFYSESDPTEVTHQRLEQDNSIRYTLLSKSGVAELNRAHEVIYTSKDFEIVAVGL